MGVFGQAAMRGLVVAASVWPALALGGPATNVASALVGPSLTVLEDPQGLNPGALLRLESHGWRHAGPLFGYGGQVGLDIWMHQRSAFGSRWALGLTGGPSIRLDGWDREVSPYLGLGGGVWLAVVKVGRTPGLGFPEYRTVRGLQASLAGGVRLGLVSVGLNGGIHQVRGAQRGLAVVPGLQVSNGL